MADKVIKARNRANKRKGYSWESESARYMNEYSFAFKRNGQRHGGKDQADMDTGAVPLAVQCKDVERISIWAVANETAGQAENKGVSDWVVFLKRRQKPTKDGLAIVPMWLYREMARTYYREFLDGHPNQPRT